MNDIRHLNLIIKYNSLSKTLNYLNKKSNYLDNTNIS